MWGILPRSLEGVLVQNCFDTGCLRDYSVPPLRGTANNKGESGLQTIKAWDSAIQNKSNNRSFVLRLCRCNGLGISIKWVHASDI